MVEPIKEKLKQSLQAAEGLYHRLVLLVEETGSGKTAILQDIAIDFDTSVININLAISTELLELTDRQRSLRLSEILTKIIEQANTPAILDNIEILFDHGLQQDPLRLLKGISRNHTVLASWNGKISGDNLVYAEAGHPKYQSYDL